MHLWWQVLLQLLPAAFFVEAAGSIVTIGKTLETSVPNPEDKDNPLNADKCTYMCKAATDKYTSFTDTKGKSPADICGDSITTLQFNLKSDQMVTDFSYYFGASDTKANGYWWGFEKRIPRVLSSAHRMPRNSPLS